VDASKLSPQLGVRWPVPVEVAPFGWQTQRQYLETLGAQVTLRQNDAGVPFQTDQGNFILNAAFGPLVDPPQLAAQIKRRTGVVEHGLFLGMADEVVVAGVDGVRCLRRTT
jgi:ribose 5-phosphate isomerase A